MKTVSASLFVLYFLPLDHGIVFLVDSIEIDLAPGIAACWEALSFPCLRIHCARRVVLNSDIVIDFFQLAMVDIRHPRLSNLRSEAELRSDNPHPFTVSSPHAVRFIQDNNRCFLNVAWSCWRLARLILWCIQPIIEFLYWRSVEYEWSNRALITLYILFQNPLKSIEASIQKCIPKPNNEDLISISRTHSQLASINREHATLLWIGHSDVKSPK